MLATAGAWWLVSVSLGVLVQALFGWHSQPLSKTPYLSPHPKKKVRCKKKKSRTCWDVSTKMRHVSVVHGCDRCHPTNCYKGGFSYFSTTEVGWAVAAFGDLYKSIVKVLQIKICQYKVNLWRLTVFLPVVSGKRWEGCYCDRWPLCPVASLWSRNCFKIQIQTRQRERYDFDWQFGFMIRFNLLPEKILRRYVPILAIWTNDNICIRYTWFSFSTDIGQPNTYDLPVACFHFTNGEMRVFVKKNRGHPNYTGLLALWNVHPELIVDQNVTVAIKKMCCVSLASSNHQHAIDDSSSAGCFHALQLTFKSQVLFFQHLSDSETLMFASSPEKGRNNTSKIFNNPTHQKRKW